MDVLSREFVGLTISITLPIPPLVAVFEIRFVVRFFVLLRSLSADEEVDPYNVDDNWGYYDEQQQDNADYREPIILDFVFRRLYFALSIDKASDMAQKGRHYSSIEHYFQQGEVWWLLNPTSDSWQESCES